MRRALTVALAASLLGVVPAAAQAPAPSPVPSPVLSEPPAGLHGYPMWDSWHDLTPFGYTQREYLVSGTATDATGAKAPYTTRMIVFRPTSKKAFNGVVMLDWVNVTAQFENAVDTMEARPMLLREGFAYVHVSAQRAGLCCTPLTPQVWDPVRYAGINHPGDAFAADMFSQVAQSFRRPRAGGPNPLGGLRPRAIIAAGQSQSASRLYAYVNETQPTARVIDGFLIHGGGSKTFPKPLTTKVVHLLSDNEAKADPPTKDPAYRLWEVAATAHSGYWIGYQSVYGLGPRVAGQPPKDKAGYDGLLEAAGTYGEKAVDPYYATCVLMGATMPMHYATSTAIHQLARWVTGGRAPVSPPRFAFSGTALAKDAHGNTLGGLRLPPADVPLATYDSTRCPLGGTTTPFTDAKVTELYPTFTDYWRRMRASTDRAVRASWLLPADARDQMRRACTAQRRWGTSAPCPSYTPPRQR